MQGIWDYTDDSRAVAEVIYDRDQRLYVYSLARVDKQTNEILGYNLKGSCSQEDTAWAQMGSRFAILYVRFKTYKSSYLGTPSIGRMYTRPEKPARRYIAYEDLPELDDNGFPINVNGFSVTGDWGICDIIGCPEAAVGTVSGGTAASLKFCQVDLDKYNAQYQQRREYI